ncbi:E3 ubiquitin-protein ligase DCST1 [Centroberyx affinis]|uniref:E3 ubiquitin-protein ligase DCST1 n=1 Tax=Centroberyx affinis TaxID=166261 RepID=UPI003A5C154A
MLQSTLHSVKRRRTPHSTLERFSLAFLPPSVHRFLFSQSDEFPAARFLLGALLGAVSGAGLFLGVAHSLPLTFDLWLAAGCVFVAVCMLGGAFSSSFRCSVLLTFPSMLGSRGRNYMMLFILSELYRGPVWNIQQNVQTAALSLGCSLDLQLQHSRLMWRETVQPFILIAQEIQNDTAEFQEEARSVSRKFQSIRDEVMSQYGYDRFSGNTTQERFAARTMMQCDMVAQQAVRRCADWFQVRWRRCMQAVRVPVISHFLCASMRFHFLCDVMRVMTPWCRQQIPVEGNFGQTFDQLNRSIHLLSREFSSELVLQEQQQQSVLSGSLQQDFSESLSRSFSRLTAGMERLLRLLQLLLSLSFTSIFTSAFGYSRRFRQDVRFDNVYISRYFRLIDARRRRAGKRCLFPLSRSERSQFIDPWSPAIHPTELRQVVRSVLQVVCVALLSAVLLAVDLSLFHMLDIVSRHSVTQFNLTSSHHVDIRVGGASMMARLLRKTVAAFNSSSSLHMTTSNQMCVSPPSPLPAGVYVTCVCSVLLAALFSCLQVYTNRLRRVIAAFHYPAREKKRVLFLYNLQIQQRISSMNRKRIISRGRRHRTRHETGLQDGSPGTRADGPPEVQTDRLPVLS